MLQTIQSLEDVEKQYQWFNEMRENQPVWLDKSSGCYHVFRFDDVNQVTTDYTLFSSERRAQVRAFRTTEDGEEVRPSLIAMDPPQHRQYRGLVSSAFTPKALARLTGRIADIAKELLADVQANGKMDIVADFAYPLPTIVIAEMLGVPTTDRPLFKKWADKLLNQQVSDAEISGSTERADLENLRATFSDMSTYFEKMLADRRLHPRVDMMSELGAAEIDGQRLTIGELVGFCTLLLLAGHVTTTNLLSQSIRCLDEHPEAMQQLREHPEMMPGAIEEVLRYASPVWRLTRTTNTDVELHGVTIPANSTIFAWVSSANRDPRHFTNPDRFDITRTPNKHIAFGHGIHFCIGAPLSRMEAAIALPIILQTLPHLQLAHNEPLQTYEGRILFGFKQLPVTFSAVNPV